MSSPHPSSFQDYKPHFRISRKVTLVAITGVLALVVVIPVSLVYGLRARHNRQDGSYGEVPDDSEDLNALCSPNSYSSGRWVWGPKTNITEMTSKEQALLFSGFESCASDRLKWWNLGADQPEKFFRFPKAHSYKWETSSTYVGLEPLEPGALLKHLVELGGWYLIGGSFQV